MVVLLVLFVSLVLFRGIGAVGIEAVSSWRGAAAWALAVMFLFTASAHFPRMKQDLINMVPKVLPAPGFLVHLTGVMEVLGAIGLLVPATRGLAGLGLVALMVAMFPANVNAALNGVPLGGRPPTPLWLRVPMQGLFVGLTWWASQT
jgi:uncharacterized membrane protein